MRLNIVQGFALSFVVGFIMWWLLVWVAFHF